MKKKIGFAIILLVASCSSKKNITNNYVLNKDTIDFGKMKFTDTLTEIIYLKNLSIKDVKITNVEVACGCTSALLKDSIINVDDSVPITIRYMPSFAKDSGAVVKFLTFRTNSTPIFTNLVIKGKVIK
jgi:hypothetical protein